MRKFNLSAQQHALYIEKYWESTYIIMRFLNTYILSELRCAPCFDTINYHVMRSTVNWLHEDSVIACICTSTVRLCKTCNYLINTTPGEELEELKVKIYRTKVIVHQPSLNIILQRVDRFKVTNWKWKLNK